MPSYLLTPRCGDAPMALKLITAPAVEPVTLDEAKLVPRA